VWDKDLLKDDFLGRIKVPLQKVTPGTPTGGWADLKEVKHGKLKFIIEVTRLMDKKSAKKAREELVDHCKKSGQKFQDADFPPDARSLYKSRKKKDNYITSWKRISELSTNPQVFVDHLNAGDVDQGYLGDCYLLGSMSVIATRKSILRPLFVYSNAEHGIYQVKFFKNGEWRIVTVDEWLPMHGNNLAYAHCAHKDEFWVPLMEKAYAKLHGCYEAIEGGNSAAAMTDLTGESSEIITFSDPAVQKKIKAGIFWHDMRKYYKERYLLGTSCTVHGASAEHDTGSGILANHAYGVLKTVPIDKHTHLVCVRNPWGKTEWRGRWADNSKEWTKAILKKLKYKFADDGIFWMALDDFVRHYDSLYVCRMLEDDYGKNGTSSSLQANGEERRLEGAPTIRTHGKIIRSML